MCLAAKKPSVDRMVEEFFSWPTQRAQALDFVQRMTSTHNVYFCATLLTDTKRDKAHVQSGQYCWADLDACQPSHLEELPSFVLETSPNRFQALWRLTNLTEPTDIEDINRRLAYKYEQFGADKGGWDLTQLLRVPFTFNHKYGAVTGQMPVVEVHKVNKVEYHYQELLEQLPQAAGYEALDIPMPTPDDLPSSTGEELMSLYHKRIQPIAHHLFAQEPERKKWSEALWQLEMFAFEAGMTVEEVFVVARDAACNKYERDGKNIIHLWKEVCRAKSKFDQQMAIFTTPDLGDLLSAGDRAEAAAYTTFVDEYMDWAKMIGDAAPQYHQAGAFILLSSLAAGPIRLPTSFGNVLPNLWFMILADTTLTRKSTAMDLAVELLSEVDSDAVMATDGSIEGLFGALQFRPGRPSIFLRDEFSGLLEAMTRKDYYAGMPETLTKLYDGKFQKRVLRKETIEVKDPVLIFFAGGIRERILQLLQYEHVASGFLPRFIFIMAESDVDRLRPLGPPTATSLEGRSRLLSFLTKFHDHYNAPIVQSINGKTVSVPAQWEAELTQEAWNLYNHYETTMMKAALQGYQPDLLTPMFDRLSKSGLKAAVLLAALQMDEKVVVTERELIKAFSYVEYWRQGAIQLLTNIGRTASERQTQNLLRSIMREPGIMRSVLMQRNHLTAREAEAILMTLEQRGSVQRIKSGRTERLYPTHTNNQNL